jgi:hypothetical protein
VPAAGDQPLKDASLRGIQVEMEWLGIEVLGEIDNTAFSHINSRGFKPIPHMEIFQIEFNHVAPEGMLMASTL